MQADLSNFQQKNFKTQPLNTPTASEQKYITLFE